MGLTWRVVSRVTAILNRILVLALAVAIARDLLWPEDPLWTSRALAFLVAHPRTTVIAAAALVLLNLDLIQFVVFSLANASGKAYIRSKAPGGTSRVALSAIQRALKATAIAVPEIAKARVEVQRGGRNRYRVHVRYKVRDVRNAGSAAEHLRLVLKKRFSELVVLDPADRVDFDLDLAGIVRVDGVPMDPKKLPAPREPRADEGFKGPVYPVEGDL